MRRTIDVIAAVLVGVLLLPGVATAAKPAPASTQLALVQEVWSYSSNPTAPAGCLNEDDSHYRNWSGGLTGTLLATEQLCDYATDGWSAGGVGLQADIWITGTLSSLTVTSPSGATQQGVFVSQTKLKGGATRAYYAVCVMPLFFLSTNIGSGSLGGGTWTVSLSGSATSVSYEVRAIMGYPDIQQQYCPPAEQNLQP